jgi:ribulose-phosphate 3-epimerase
VSPSILSCDFAHLADEVAAVAPATDWVHVDVMDAHYVPNLTLGLPIVESLRKATPLQLDCHLMIDDPDTWAPRYAATADSVTVHVETARDRVGLAKAIRDGGARAGIAVDKQTDVTEVLDVLPHYDMLLVMTIQAGFGGQSFVDDLLAKVRTARKYLDEHGLELWLQVDGGVNAETIERCAEAGADVFVAGTAVYGAADRAEAVRALRKQAEAATR